MRIRIWGELVTKVVRYWRDTTHHTDEKTALLGSTADTGVTDDADGETSSETGETDRETGTELDEAGVQWHWGLDCGEYAGRGGGGRRVDIRSPEMRTETTRPY